MYEVIFGNTFETVSRKVYGSEIYANDIAQANPGASDPLTPGVTLIIPDNSNITTDQGQQSPSSDQDEVAVLINGQRFRFWSSLRITRSIDAVDTITFSAPFEPELSGFKESLRPFSYYPITVTVGGAPLFKGTMLDVLPRADTAGKTVSVSGYSTPGVLGDCTGSVTAPVEYSGQNLKSIASAVIKPFGLSVVFKDTAGAAFSQVSLNPTQKVLAFLTTLAKQRNLIISSTEKGELLFQKSIEVGTPSATLRQGESPLISVTPTFSPQQYYSHITGIEPVVVGLGGGVFTVKNGRLKNLLRPYTFEASDSDGGTLQAAVQAKAGRMFGNMVSYRAEVDTWRDPSGDMWTPNTLIQLEAKSAMIYSPYSFVLRSVEFSRTGTSKTAVLDLVIPGSFSGKIPEVLPWD